MWSVLIDQYCIQHKLGKKYALRFVKKPLYDAPNYTMLYELLTSGKTTDTLSTTREITKKKNHGKNRLEAVKE